MSSIVTGLTNNVAEKAIFVSQKICFWGAFLKRAEESAAADVSWLWRGQRQVEICSDHGQEDWTVLLRLDDPFPIRLFTHQLVCPVHE